MWAHYSSEEKRKFIIFSIVGITATLVFAGIIFYLISPKKDAAVEVNKAEQAAQALKDAQEVASQYMVALKKLKTEINSMPAGESIADKVESSLFGMRVPKEMLDKHLQAVLAVGKLKNGKDAAEINKEAKSMVEGLMAEAVEIK